MSSDKKNKCTNLCRHISSTAGKLLGIEDTLLLISFECVCSSRGTFRRNIILPKPLPPADWRWWSREYRWKGRDSGLSGSTVKSLSSPDPVIKSFSNVSLFPQDLSQENATWCRQIVVAEAMDEHLQLPGRECCKYCENIGCINATILERLLFGTNS